MKRPFITLCISLLVGIVGAYLFNYFIPINYVLYAAIISLIVLLFYEKVFLVFLFLTVVILGSYLYGQSIAGDALLNSVPSNTLINIKVLKEGSFKKGFSEYEVEIVSLAIDKIDKNIKVNKNAQLKIYGSSLYDPVINVGDTIRIDHVKVIKLLNNMSADNPNNYERYLKSKGIEYILETNSENININSISQYKSAGLRNMSYRMKIYLEDFLDSTLDFENSNVLKSIIFGNQGYLSKDKLSTFSKTGTAHIMAVSGLHVGLIVIVLDKFLKLIKVRRNNRLYLTVAILIFYGYMVCFPISIIRAGIMYILYVIAYFLQRRYDGINAIFFIAFILLIYRPMTIFSISFQLSFIATLSILLLTPILNEQLSKRIGFLGTLLSVTLAAQIGTLPIMAYHFKQISIISVLTNLIIVPILGPMLSIVFISVLLGAIYFRLGFIINQITNQLLNYINWISTKCAIIPYGSFEINEIKLTYIFLYYIILVIIYYIYKQKSNLKEEGLVNTYEL